jgi:hypothetical protein
VRWFQHLQAAKHKKKKNTIVPDEKKNTKINKRYITVKVWAAERQLEINFFQKLFQNMEEIYFETLHSRGREIGRAHV